MSIEGGPKQIDQQPELPKVEAPLKPVADSEGLASGDLKAEEKAARERDNAKIEEVRASLGLEQAPELSVIKQHLQEHLGLKEDGIEKVSLLKTKNLPEHYQAQREALHDERLDKITIAVVPDDLWVKGSQPSESSAENQLILIKQSYFEAQENPDEIAWLSHELSHCQNFLNSESPEEYQGNMQKFAFEDIARYMSISRKDLEQELNQAVSHGVSEDELTRLKQLLESTNEDSIQVPIYYPNNPVEQYTFTKQFQYLKEQGKSREEVLAMLGEHYEEEDFPFFNRLLDGVYEK